MTRREADLGLDAGASAPADGRAADRRCRRGSSRLERGGEGVVFVLGELLDHQGVDRVKHWGRVELIVGQIGWQQGGPVRGLSRGSDGVIHG